MADEVEPTADTQRTRKSPDTQMLRGGLLQNYGVPMGVGGMLIALVEFLGSEPGQTFKLLAQFGPRWLFFTVLVVLLWDLSKRLLKLAGRAVGHIGELAANTGRAADGVQIFAAKNDRAVEEQQRLTSFSVSMSSRAVELVTITNELHKAMATKVDENGDLLRQIAKKVGTDVNA